MLHLYLVYLSISEIVLTEYTPQNDLMLSYGDCGAAVYE